MQTPEISVIIPTFNRAKMVCDCVKSVLATGYPALEVIVVDDCSPDDTKAQIASTFGTDSRIKYLRNNRNSFQAVSRNNGRKAAHGTYLLFLDDDNIVHPEIFTEILKVFKAHPNAGLVAPMAIHQRPGKENAIWSLGSDFNRWTSQPKDNKPNLPLDQLPAKPTVYPTTYYPNGFMVSAESFDKIGGFDERYVVTFEESEPATRNSSQPWPVRITMAFLNPAAFPNFANSALRNRAAPTALRATDSASHAGISPSCKSCP